MATYMNQTNSGRIIVQQTSPSAIIVQPDNERKIILKGSGGLKGEIGEQGPQGPQGEQGPQGPAGQGVITGGSTGQVLTKKSGTDYDTEWTTPATYSDFTGATSSVAGAHGLVPAPTTSDPDKFLKGDGTWGTPPGATYTGGTGIDITGNVVSVDNTIATVTDLGKKVDVASIDLTGQATTLLALTKALGTNNIDYGRWECRTDIGSANISDKPTGYNASFVCEAYCNRWTASNDYRYQLICWVKENTNPFVAYIANNSSSITWERLRPTVNDATLTIQKNGTTVETFTANSSANKTANIAVPTKTSDLTNDGADGTSTYVEAGELAPGYITGDGTSITLPGTQGGRFSDVKLKGDTKQGATPTPSTPQTVQTVTGEQTIAINDGDQQSQTYTINLGTTELCKIGNYQDYIYKNNGTWYLHKETYKVSADYSAGGYNSGNNWFYYSIMNNNLPTPVSGAEIISDYFVSSTRPYMESNKNANGLVALSTTTDIIMRNTAYTTEASYEAWLASAAPVFYYPLATPTDTPITGALLNDLNAFDQATSYQGNTYITVSSVSPDLPATLSVAVEQESALPVATETSVGMVSVGEGLSITGGGVLSVNPSKKEVYSTDEQVVGTWIDGKPLYRKVVQFTSPANTYTFTQVATGITNADYAFIENGAIKNTAEGWSIQINSARGTSDNGMMNFAVAAWVRLQPNATNFAVSVASGLNNQPMWVSVLYTKTTD